MENTAVACKCTKLDVKFSFELSYVVILSFCMVLLRCKAEDFKKSFSEQGGFPTRKSRNPITL